MSRPEARGSGWQEDLPADWEVPQLWTQCSQFALYGANIPASNYVQDGLRFLRTSDLTDFGKLKNDNPVFVAPEDASGYRLQDGDVLLSRSGTLGRSFVYEHEEHGPCTYAGYLVLYRPGRGLDSRFLFYFTKSQEFEAWLRVNAIESTIGNVSGQKFSAMRIPLPPLPTQRAIASFLDRETAKIDTLIEKKRRLLDLLEEKRTALITRAVTRGLDPDVPVKHSGVEWLGEIPEHWEVVRVGLRYAVQLGKMLDSSRITGDHLRPYLRVADVQWGEINTQDLPEMDFSPRDRQKYRLEAGDLLVNEGGSYVGRTAMWTGELDECYYQKALHRLRPRSNRDNPEFFVLVMRWATELGVFVAGGNQTTIDHLTAEQLKSYRFAFPPRPEQDRIVEAVSAELGQQDIISTRVLDAISLLQEYRTSLISHAVTGKIDVREEVPA